MSNFWQTERLRLRAVEPDDWSAFFEWNLDSEGARNLYLVPVPKSRAAEQKDTEEAALKKPDKDEFFCFVETLAGEAVGGISTHHCDLRCGTFMYGIFVQPEQQRKGYASEVVRLLLRYMFEERRYQKCTVEVFEYNAGSLALHQSLGFQQEGRLRRMRYTQGQFWDIFCFGITAEEFAARFGK